LAAISDVRVDPDHHFLLRRQWGDTARFALRAPAAHTVELMGSFLGKPVAATRTGDIWSVEVPLTEGRYVWLWRVDGTPPPDETAITDAKRPPGDLEARAGVLVVKPVRRLSAVDSR
jgi:1,4-alpha-glucan branching enzyme